MTIGVLTKVDRIEPGAEDAWIKIFCSRHNNLTNQWFAVKQPDFAQLRGGISWDEAKAAERLFFQSTPPWSSLSNVDRRRLGYPGLADHLSRRLSDLVMQKYVRRLVQIIIPADIYLPRQAAGYSARNLPAIEDRGSRSALSAYSDVRRPSA